MPDVSPERLETARLWALRWQRSRRVPAVALVVTDRHRTVLLEVSGLADRAGMRPATADQRWQIGSISKAFTSVAVLQLQQEGRLSVGDRVVDHLPWADRLSSKTTLHHLMSHTAGLPTGSEWTPDSLLESALQGTIGAPQPPGGRYHYSNPGYELLGDVVETVTGLPLEAHLEQRVVRPLGMLTSSASIVGEDRDRDVRGHRPPRDDVLWRGETDQVPDAFFPSCTADGAMVATPADMAVYLRFLLAGGADGVLDATSFGLLAGRHVRTEDGWYGYGLTTTEDEGRQLLGHSGGMVGMFADVRVDRDSGVGSCLMVNGYSDVWEANGHLLRLLTGRAGGEPTWPPAAPRLDTDVDPQHASRVGLYRSYNPWAPTLRVVSRGEQLWLVDPVTGEESTLHPQESTTGFHVGHPESPDVVDFDVEVSGVYQRLTLSGAVYGRVRRDDAQ